MAYQFLVAHDASWVVGREWNWIDLRWCKGRFESVLEKQELTISRDVPVLLHRAMYDSSALVRRVGAHALIQNLTSLNADALPLAQRLAADRNESVAERGRHALQRVSESRGQASLVASCLRACLPVSTPRLPHLCERSRCP